MATSCEEMNCPFWDARERRCTDDDPRYKGICRKNPYRQTQEGQDRLAAWGEEG